MSDGNIRIIEMTAADAVEDNDFLAIDNNSVAQSNDDTTAGTRKVRAKDFVQASLTVDETPTEDSENLVTSGGVYDAVDGLNDKITSMEIIGTASGEIATFDDGSANPIKELTAQIVAVQSGSGDPSPENVRPISGWDGANVGNCQPLQVMVPTSSLPMTLNGVTLEHLGGGKYKVCGNMTAAQNTVFSVDFDSFSIYDGTDSTIAFNNTYASNNINFTFLNGNTTVENWVLNPINRVTTYSGMRGKTTNGFKLTIASNMYGSPIDFTFQVMLYGSTNSTTYPISWQTECGTVYGGNFKLFKDNGKWYCTVTADRANVNLGTLTWNYGKPFGGANEFFWTSGLSGVAVFPTVTTKTDAVCSCFYAESANEMNSHYSTTDGAFSLFNNWVIVHDNAYTDAATFKTAMNGVQLVYELATPETYTFEISTEIATLLGNNNIFADCGDVEVRYIRDLNLVINKLLNA